MKQLRVGQIVGFPVAKRGHSWLSPSLVVDVHRGHVEHDVYILVLDDKLYHGVHEDSVIQVGDSFTEEYAESFRTGLEELADKYPRQRGAASARYGRHGADVLRKEERIDPSQSGGSPEPAQEPIRLADWDRPSELNHQFTRHLDRRFPHAPGGMAEDDAYYAAADRMRRRNPRWHEVWMLHEEGRAYLDDKGVVQRQPAQKLAEIARELGISLANAQQRKSRAKRFMKEHMAALLKGRDDAA